MQFPESPRLPSANLLPLLAICVTAFAHSDDNPLLVDWVPRSELSIQQQENLHPACCGLFVAPQRDDEWATMDPETAPMQIDAPDGISQPSQGQLLIQGAVQILQGYRSVTASERSELDESEETLNLRGNVLFREPGILLTGDSALVDQRHNTSRLDQAAYVMYDTQMHGRADSLEYNGETGFLTISNGEFSRCEPGAPFWLLRAAQLDLDPARGIGRAREVTLTVHDVPVFHYPFSLQFPIGDQRVTGVLAPSFTNSRRGGLDIAVPYYFNLAPHYDATVTPRLIEKRGGMLGVEFRYLANWSMNTFDVTLLPDDSTYDRELSVIPGSDSPPTRDRWFLGYEHEGIINDNWSTRVDFNAVSDVDYFRDLGTRGLSLDNRTHLNRQGQLRFRSENWQAETNLQRIEIIDPFLADDDINRPFDRLPEIRVRTRQFAGDLVQYDLNAAWARFDRGLNRNRLSPSQINNGALVTGHRLTLEPQISLPWRTPGIFVVPSAKYRYTSWQLDRQAVDTSANPTRGVPTFSLDSGLVFDRTVSAFGGSYNQTLEPRLYYLYTPYEEQGNLPLFDTSQLRLGFNQLFRDNRYSGGDRIGDANQLTAALSTRLYDEQGFERLAFSLGQIFHFRDRRVTPDSPLQRWLQLQPVDDSRSALVAEGYYAMDDNWQLRSDLHWNELRGTVDEGSLTFSWLRDDRSVFNAGYRYRALGDVFLQSPGGLDRRIRQTDISGVLPLNENWQLFGRWNYDHSNSRNLETFAGVEYSNCCATMRVLLRDWVNDYEFLNQQARQNRGLYFQLSLHGLGNITGAGISNLLSDGIPGFKEHLFNE